MFEPDIIVTGPDPGEYSLVVECQISSPLMDEAERQLTIYMTAVGSPTGLLVSPERLAIYRDRYLPSEDSVVRVEEVDLQDLFRFHRTGNAVADSISFERQVQSWLEILTTEVGLQQMAPELRRACQMYIIPALAGGSVRSGHPRIPKTA